MKEFQVGDVVDFRGRIGRVREISETEITINWNDGPTDRFPVAETVEFEVV